MATSIHPRVDPLADMLLILGEAAVSAVQDASRQRERELSGKNHTLRPGPETPRWNQLVDLMQPLLARRGAKALLARELGLPRQRVHEFFVGRTRLPDAERALAICIWATRQRPVPTPQGT